MKNKYNITTYGEMQYYFAEKLFGKDFLLPFPSDYHLHKASVESEYWFNVILGTSQILFALDENNEESFSARFETVDQWTCQADKSKQPKSTLDVVENLLNPENGGVELMVHNDAAIYSKECKKEFLEDEPNMELLEGEDFCFWAAVKEVLTGERRVHQITMNKYVFMHYLYAFRNSYERGVIRKYGEEQAVPRVARYDAAINKYCKEHNIVINQAKFDYLDFKNNFMRHATYEGNILVVPYQFENMSVLGKTREVSKEWSDKQKRKLLEG